MPQQDSYKAMEHIALHSTIFYYKGIDPPPLAPSVACKLMVSLAVPQWRVSYTGELVHGQLQILFCHFALIQNSDHQMFSLFSSHWYPLFVSIGKCFPISKYPALIAECTQRKGSFHFTMFYIHLLQRTSIRHIYFKYMGISLSCTQLKELQNEIV